MLSPPVIDNVSSPATVCEATDLITITGNNFNSAFLNVTLGGVPVNIVSHTNTEIICTAGAGNGGQLTVATSAGAANGTDPIAVNQLITVNAGNDIMQCTGMTAISFSDMTATGPYNAITWSDVSAFGTLTGSGTNPANYTFTPAVPVGSLEITVTLSGPGACNSTVSDTRRISWGTAGSWLGLVNNNWNEAGNWCGGIPTNTTDVYIPAIGSVPNQPVINAAGAVSRNITNDGTLTISGANNLDVYGNWVNNNQLAIPSGTVTFRGSAGQTIAGTGNIFYNLHLNNAAGVTLSDDVQVTNNLLFTNGVLHTGSHNINLHSATVSGAGANKFVEGNLQKNINGNATKIFETGDANGYAPVTITFTGATNNTGNLVVSAKPGSHPEINTSFIDPAKKVDRYWSITNQGVSGFTAYNGLFGFDAGAIIGGANFSQFRGEQYNGSDWRTMAVSNLTVSGARMNNITAFGDFIFGEELQSLACAFNSGTLVLADVMPCIDALPSQEIVIGNNLHAAQYFTMHVVQGFRYEIYSTGAPANDFTSSALKLSVYNENVPAAPAIAYGSGNTGNPKATSGSNDVYLNFTAPFSGRVRVLLNQRVDCDAVLPGAISLFARVGIGSANTIDDKNATGSGPNKWRGQIYLGTNAAQPISGTFAPYLGYYDLFADEFYEMFPSNGSITCFNVFSDGSQHANVLTDNFSVRYRMTSSKHGLYTIEIGSDEGGRLAIDGTLVYNSWSNHSFVSHKNVLLQLNGSSELTYDYYGAGGDNRVIFLNHSPLIINKLTESAALDQTLCAGSTGMEVTGDTFAALPAYIFTNGTGYQWLYKTSELGPATAIPGATGASYTPIATGPFATPGTYYIYRNASLISQNNTGVNNYTATVESSNFIKLTVTANPLVAPVVTGAAEVCVGANTTPFTANMTAGAWSIINGTGTAEINAGTQVVSGLSAGEVQVAYTINDGNTCIKTGTKTLHVRPLPLVYQLNITGGGVTKEYCASETGLSVTINNSQTGVRYELYRDGTATGITRNGSDGVSLVFPVATPAVAGTYQYTVKANTVPYGCEIDMDGTITFTIHPMPTGDLVTDKSAYCVGDVVTLTAPAGYNQYVFRSGSQILYSGANSEFSTNTLPVGSASLTVTMVSEFNCSTTSTPVNIVVNPLPTGIFTASETSGINNDNIICAGSNVNFTFDSHIPTYVNYIFVVNGSGRVIYDGPNFYTSASDLEDGDEVSLIITTNAGCTTTFGPISFTVNPYPASPSAITGSTSVCQGQNGVTFQVDPVANATGYNWVVPAGATIVAGSNTNAITVNFSSTAISGNVAVVGTNGCGTGETSSLAVVVDPLPVAAGTIAGKSTVCQGENMVTYSVPVINYATSYEWIYSGNNVTISTTDVVDGFATVTINFANNATSGSLSVKGINDCGEGIGSTSFPIAVNLLPAAAGSIFGSASACVGSTGVVYSVSNIANASQYVWSYDGGTVNISGDTNPVTIDFSLSATSGTLSVSGSNACGLGVASMRAIVLNPLPKGTLTISETSGLYVNDGIICAGGTIQFTANVTNGAANNYQFFVNGISVQNGASKTYTTSSINSNVSVSVIVRSTFGCVASFDPVDITVNTLPDVSISGPNTICQGGMGVHYETQQGNTNYVWQILGGVAVNGTSDYSVDVNWTGTGTKQINVNYTDGNGCTAQQSATLATSPTVVPLLTGDNELCLNSTGITYTTDGSADKSDFVWTVTNGSVVSGGGEEDYFVTVDWDIATGPHSVSVNYANSDGCNAAAPTVLPVNIYALPAASISAGVTVCENSPASITLTGSGGTRAYTFNYLVGGEAATAVSTTSSSDNYILHPATDEPGTFEYELIKVTDNHGCSSNIEGQVASVTVTPKPQAAISYSADPLTYLCKSSTEAAVTHTGTAGGVYNATPAGLSINSATGTINPSASNAGNYTVRYFIAPAGGCVAFTATTNVTITNLPTVSISYNNNNPVCASVTNVNVSRSGTGAYQGGTYTATPAGLSINATSGAINPSTSAAGTYNVTYTTLSSGGCEAVTVTTQITISAVPAATISYSGSPYCSSLTSAAVTFSNTAGAFEGGSFTFTPVGLVLDAHTGTINPSASVTGKTYTVRYHIPASQGCAAVVSAPATVSITPKPTVDAGDQMTTCAASGTVNVSPGTATNFSSLLWTTSGDGTFTNANSANGASYTPGTNDIQSGGAILTLTATGLDNCATVSANKQLVIYQNPIPVVVSPSTATYCVGAVQPLTSVEDIVSNGNPTFSSTTNNVAIPDNNFTGISNAITVSGIPVNAIISSIDVRFNIAHVNDKDLIINLKAPHPQNPFYGELNLVNSIPASGVGQNFTNTHISSNSSQPIQNFGTAPYTGTFAPHAVFGALGSAFANSFNQLYTGGGSLNGNWVLRVVDNGNGDIGSLGSWSIQITYTVPENPVNVMWTPATDLYTDAAATQPYVAGTLLSTVFAKLTSSGVHTISATAGEGCTTTTEVVLTSKPSPSVFIKADYCSDPEGRVTLVAESGEPVVSYNWSNGATTPTTYVDIAHNYSVSVTNSEGCVGTNTIDIAQELVINGDFTQGNVGFTTGYAYHADDPARTDELVTDTGNNGYGVGVNGQNYHTNFWGEDHTNNQTGDRNFMIINGHGGITIWEQYVPVKPNTRYYYSAWASNLNTVGNYAKLQFEVNDKKIGTIADLNLADKPGSAADVNLNNWIRFYYGNEDGWLSSDTATVAKIRIINIEPAAAGNDFGIDDISFATLSPFITGPVIAGSDMQDELCTGEQIIPITYKVGSGAQSPEVTGLPPDLMDQVSFDGLNLVISGTSNYAGIWNYTVKTGGDCANPKAATGTITIKPSATLSLTSAATTKNQTTCIGAPMDPVIYVVGGGATSASVTGLPAGMYGVFDNTTKLVTISGSATVSGTFEFIVSTSGTCIQKADTGTITISPAAVGGSINQPTACLGETVTLTLSGNSGNIIRWEVSKDGGASWTAVSNTTNTYSYQVNEAATFRALSQVSTCSPATSIGGRVRINNLWEGKISSAWNVPGNWSSGNLPNTNCSNTITIAPGTPYQPEISTAVAVTNLNILDGGRLTVSENGVLKIAGVVQKAATGTLDVLAGTVEFNGANQAVGGSLFKDRTVHNLVVSTGGNGLTVSSAANDTLNITGLLSFGNTSADLNSGNNITLKSNSGSTASVGVLAGGNVITGDFIVERYINTGTHAGSHPKSWQLLAVPVVGQTIKQAWQEGATATNLYALPGSAGNPHPGYGTMLTSNVAGAATQTTPGFDVFTAPGPSIKIFNSATEGYDGPSSTALPLYNQKGYMILVRGDRSVYTSSAPAVPTVLRAKGKLFTPTNPPPSTNVAVGKFESVGNPYASSIDLRKLSFGTNLNTSVMVWDPSIGNRGYGLGAFQTLYLDNGNYVNLLSSAAYGPAGTSNNFIQSGQAFIIQAGDDSGSLTFKETDKAGAGSNKMLFREQSPQKAAPHIRVNLYSFLAGAPVICDGTLIQFDSEYANALDKNDVRKTTNTSENFAISSNGKVLVIERRKPVAQNDTIFYSLKNVRVQKYRFEVTVEGLDDGTQAFLEDVYLKTKKALTPNSVTSVDFTIENVAGSYAPDRFRIVFKATEKTLPVTFTSIAAKVINNNGLINWKVAGENGMQHYELEHSIDGVTFERLAVIPAQNKSEASYEFVDEKLTVGNHYYRVGGVDAKGQVSYTKVVKVWVAEATGPASIAVYPNPITNGVVHLQLKHQPAGQYNIRLLNPAGQLILSRNTEISAENHTEKINWDYKLSHGMYQLEVRKPDGGLHIIKLIY